MRLNDAASSPSSSLDSTSTLAPRSPAATRRAASSQRYDGARHAGCEPQAGQHGNEDSNAADQHRGGDNLPLQFDQRTPRTADEQNAQQLLLAGRRCG